MDSQQYKLGEPTVIEDLSPGDLSHIRHTLEQSALALGADSDALGELIVALNEAIVNIIRHGYKNHPGRIEITMVREGANLGIKITDNADLFNPLSVPKPDTTLPLSQRPFGGLGVHMMREFSDEVQYQITPDGKNELTICKRNAIKEPL